jgi:DNA-binding CsgD family transcriptional regulator
MTNSHDSRRSGLGVRSTLRENLTESELIEFEDVLIQAARLLDDPAFSPAAVHDFDAATAMLRQATDAVSSAVAGDVEMAQRLLGAERAMEDARVRYRDSAIKLAREALESIQHLETVEQIFKAGAKAVCDLGFDRAIVSRLEESMWTTEVIHVAGDEAWAAEILEAGKDAPQQIVAGLPEQELVRRRKPIIVMDVQERSQVHKAVAEVSASRAYVAAPIAPSGEVIGFLHGDRVFHSGDLTSFDRDLLGLFAQGFSFAVERAALYENIRGLQAQAREIATTLEAAASRTYTAGVLDTSRMPASSAGPHESNPITINQHHHYDSPLTRRELDVLRLMANGDTNQRIARRLVISEGTVKSHVKHVLRKLNAANRAEAVARWHQSMHRSSDS